MEREARATTGIPGAPGVPAIGHRVTAYFDATAFLKIVVADEHWSEVAELFEAYQPVATVRATLVEVAAMLGHARLGGVLTAEEADAAWKNLLAIWDDCVVLEVTSGVVRSAAEVALRHGADDRVALHLAAAQLVSAGAPMVCYDPRVAEAARAIGLWVLPT